jgi:ATPase subunit of ABC transporter with duplicated ATPase domains
MMFGLPIGWIVAGVLALGAGSYVIHCEHVKKDRDQMIASLRQQAEDQKKEIAKEQDRTRKAKEDADESAKNQLERLQRDLVRLRNERARASSVPTAPASTSRPDLACFDRTELDRAVGNLEAGVEGFIAEGAASAIELNAAKAWAADIARTAQKLQ